MVLCLAFQISFLMQQNKLDIAFLCNKINAMTSECGIPLSFLAVLCFITVLQIVSTLKIDSRCLR